MEKKEPVFERRLGNIRVAIWENNTDAKAGEAGKVWHNVAITRKYLVGEEWRESATFAGLRDLALLGECVTLAKNWIAQRQEELQKSQAA